MVIEYRFVAHEPDVDLVAQMSKGGMQVEADGDPSVALVAVEETDVWVNEGAWIEAVESHYSCVFDGTTD